MTNTQNTETLARTTHVGRVAELSRGGDVVGYAPRCSCGWGYSEKTYGARADAQAAADAHADAADS